MQQEHGRHGSGHRAGAGSAQKPLSTIAFSASLSPMSAAMRGVIIGIPARTVLKTMTKRPCSTYMTSLALNVPKSRSSLASSADGVEAPGSGSCSLGLEPSSSAGSGFASPCGSGDACPLPSVMTVLRRTKNGPEQGTESARRHSARFCIQYLMSINEVGPVLKNI